MSDESGIHAKFHVERTDGSSAPGGKHERCSYFVLDLEHDPFAIPALKAYAEACRGTHPGLSRDLDKITSAVRRDPIRCNCREAMCEHTATCALSPSETAWLLMRKPRP